MLWRAVFPREYSTLVVGGGAVAVENSPNRERRDRELRRGGSEDGTSQDGKNRGTMRRTMGTGIIPVLLLSSEREKTGAVTRNGELFRIRRWDPWNG